ncbi:MAG: hypothetical protein AUH05_08600 [Ktedonobacter sp. 13_2_20CM_53_11]|nr:MAG: hypothetical protein AUH05_08600 [Ktedonobacter sp. 13_2_20CM_53_11]
MTNQEHLDLLKQGVACWNDWRAKNPTIPPDLKRAELARIDLPKANLSDTYLNEANLSQAHLREANLVGADLSKADLRQATLCYANLTWANLSEADLAAADLTGANLSWASLRLADLSAGKLIGTNLSGTNLTEGNLSQANLNNAILVRTNLQRANLTACSIYGVSTWDVQLEGVIQANLIITLPGAPTITVDDLEVAQFIYLLLNNKKLRDVIDTITSKVVLILGRFTLKRRTILDALREELRKYNYLPIVFDFDKAASRDLTETVITLAHLSRFIIVDLTDPSSAPHEVATVIPQCVVPVQPLLSLQPLIVDEKEVERREYAMFQDLRRRYSWVLPTFRYQDTADVLASLKEKIIDPAELKVKELVQQK